jgi:putative membrane protein
MTFLIQVVVTAALLLVVANLVRGVDIEGWGGALVAALILGLVNAIVRPIMVFLTFPLTIVTFGLFLFIVNALMLQLTSAIVPGMKVKGFGPALLGSLVLSLLNVVVGMLAGIF